LIAAYQCVPPLRDLPPVHGCESDRQLCGGEIRAENVSSGSQAAGSDRPKLPVEVTEENPWVDRLLSKGKTRVLTCNVVKT